VALAEFVNQTQDEDGQQNQMQSSLACYWSNFSFGQYMWSFLLEHKKFLVHHVQVFSKYF
jgi:hypothetical protein